MRLNGVDLFRSCGLDRLVVGRDGVCAAAVNEPNEPRAACFDTRTAGLGAEQLFSWIQEQVQGTTVMVVTCSRLAFPFNRDRVAQAMRMIGALDPPTRIDDAYALIGTKGGSAPLSENRTPCCTEFAVGENGIQTDVCAVCDQSLTTAEVTTACGARAAEAGRPSVLKESGVVLEDWASENYVAAIGSISGGHLIRPSQAVANGVLGLSSVINSQQGDDADDVLDAVCATGLVSSLANSRFGARLASDGNPSTYWYSSGRLDAVLTIDLGSTQQVNALLFNWRHPARALMVLVSNQVSSTKDWVLVGQHNGTSAPTRVALASDDDPNRPNSTGVSARRLRIYLAQPENSSAPIFALNELKTETCASPKANASAPSLLRYTRASTAVVQDVAPKRGSTAGGTDLKIFVDNLPAAATHAAITVLVAGVSCAVSHVSSDHVRCLTGSYGRTSAARTGEGAVELTIAGFGAAVATENCTYEYVDLWSRVSTWGGVGASIPGIGANQLDSVWIQKGQKILLDLDVRIYMLIIEGSLEFERMDLYLDINYIFVFNGRFAIGTETEPFLHKASITLYGSPVSQESTFRYSLSPLPIHHSHSMGAQKCTTAFDCGTHH